LRRLLGDLPGASRIQLAPLSVAAVRQLARAAGRDATGVFELTGGNPFFVTELIEAGGMPATVRDAVLTPMALQSRATREFLELLAIVPGTVEEPLLAVLGAAHDAEFEEALGSGLLQPVRGGVSFRHELARRAVEQSLALPRLRALHARALAA